MDWVKKVLSVSSLPSGQTTPPPAYGNDASPAAVSNSQKMEKKREEREESEKAGDGLLLVVNGAKIKCALCTNPIGTLIVSDMNPTIDGQPMATISDKAKSNLVFTGNCRNSPKQRIPCIAYISPLAWTDTATCKAQGKPVIRQQSTIGCAKGGTISVVHCGQS